MGSSNASTCHYTSTTFFFLMFINIIQQINYTQHRYNNCDHEAEVIIRNRIASIKTGKKKNSKTEILKTSTTYTKVDSGCNNLNKTAEKYGAVLQQDVMLYVYCSHEDFQVNPAPPALSRRTSCFLKQ